MKLLNILLFISLFFPSIAFSEINDENYAKKMLSLTNISNATERLSEIENLYKISSKYQKYLLLPIAAKQAVIIKKYDRAKYFATELLKFSNMYKNDWNYGNAVHDGNMVLGMIALKNGNTENAKIYLIKSGKISGSPQLSSFGPEMMLAHALLEKGERSIVIEYLKLCKVFWKKDSGRIDSWIASIKGGGRPYFGINLSNQ